MPKWRCLERSTNAVVAIAVVRRDTCGSARGGVRCCAIRHGRREHCDGACRHGAPLFRPSFAAIGGAVSGPRIRLSFADAYRQCNTHTHSARARARTHALTRVRARSHTPRDTTRHHTTQPHARVRAHTDDHYGFAQLSPRLFSFVYAALLRTSQVSCLTWARILCRWTFKRLAKPGWVCACLGPVPARAAVHLNVLRRRRPRRCGGLNSASASSKGAMWTSHPPSARVWLRPKLRRVAARARLCCTRRWR